LTEPKTSRKKIPFAGPLDFNGRKSVAYLRLHVLDAGFALNPDMKDA
jgi:hypothetical protein